MTSQKSYNYLSKTIFLSSFLFLLLFIIFNFNYKYKYNVNFTESFLTIFFSLLILSFLTINSLDNDEFNYLLFYFTFIGAIPLIYHSLYLILFKKYQYENMSYIKIGIIGIIMIYLSIVWFNVKKLVNKNTIYINNKLMFTNMLQILFTLPF
jgi:ABC-type iron transport system FetAB permease component